MKKRGNRKDSGRPDSFEKGYREGYRQGTEEGRRQFGSRMEGTSIVIPAAFGLDRLKTCLDRIDQYTEQLHEVIVVVLASADGVEAWLKEQGGRIRFRILDRQEGLVGAVNTGLMMAKGQTILLLNGDEMISENWLGSLLEEFDRDPKAGFKEPDIGREIRGGDGMAGECGLLLKKEFLEAAGFLDEGFEDVRSAMADYEVRARLLGLYPVCSGRDLRDMTEQDQSFFTSKWNQPNEWIRRVGKMAANMEIPISHAGAFYPERVAVQGAGPQVYWIEDGLRRPVEGNGNLPAARISQIDLRRWPAGLPIEAEEAESRWRGHDGASCLLFLRDETPYHVEDGKVRRIANAAALQAWNLHLKPSRTVSPVELSEWTTGLPIFAPPLLRQSL